ncbi:TPA: protein translocase subunit SecF [bacterium]|nr:MAG: protein-export membrane protein SecF [Candidatus Hydrogenedentes bacterium CG1_02_42_14]PIU48205.1 MAG: protein translocase subunit SecF [Candidatus Hydrogenedentes bacterium CG07_land_8_20_14_0_80_42_17]HBW48087.1 protein translocase subunit SecF [bacterium]
MNRVFSFIEVRNRAYLFSLTLLIIFIVGTAIHGGFNFGIDFVGGTSVIVKFDKSIDAKRLSELRSFLEPVGLSQNIRTIGGSGEEAREISIDVRGTDWVDRMTARFFEAKKNRKLTPEDLDSILGSFLEPKALTGLKAYFMPPAGDTAAPPLFDINNVTTGDMTGIFQTIFNENIALSVHKVLSKAMLPEGGIKDIDINNIGNAQNLSEALAEVKRKKIEITIAEKIDTVSQARPWTNVDEFLKSTGLELFDGPVLRRILTADTQIQSKRVISILTATPEELSKAFIPSLTERFLQNSKIVVEHRDRDFGGLFLSSKQAADIVPESDREMREMIANYAHAGRFIIASSETVGASVGKDLKWAALWAIFYSLLGLLAYIWFRFELRYAVGAIIATIHDTILTLGLIGFAGIEFNIPIVAAVLTVMGYSVNDTIVVYDRIREKLGKLKAAPDPAIIDLAIQQTLSRTILTAGTTIVTILVFLIFGPAVTRELSFTLTFGIFIGTFSSIFVAAPVLVEWERLSGFRKKR